MIRHLSKGDEDGISMNAWIDSDKLPTTYFTASWVAQWVSLFFFPHLAIHYPNMSSHPMFVFPLWLVAFVFWSFTSFCGSRNLPYCVHCHLFLPCWYMCTFMSCCTCCSPVNMDFVLRYLRLHHYPISPSILHYTHYILLLCHLDFSSCVWGRVCSVTPRV